MSRSDSRKRRISCVTKDTNKNIATLGGDWGGTVTKREAINQIESGVYEYYVKADGVNEVKVCIVRKKSVGTLAMLGINEGEYLRTSPDEKYEDNLGNLPICPG